MEYREVIKCMFNQSPRRVRMKENGEAIFEEIIGTKFPKLMTHISPNTKAQ